MVEAFPYTIPPRYLLRDRDGIYGADFVHRVEGLGLEQKLIAVGSENAWRRHLTEREGGANTEVRLVRWKANIGLGDEQAALERLAGDHAGED